MACAMRTVLIVTSIIMAQKSQNLRNVQSKKRKALRVRLRNAASVIDKLLEVAKKGSEALGLLVRTSHIVYELLKASADGKVSLKFLGDATRTISRFIKDLWGV